MASYKPPYLSMLVDAIRENDVNEDVLGVRSCRSWEIKSDALGFDDQDWPSLRQVCNKPATADNDVGGNDIVASIHWKCHMKWIRFLEALCSNNTIVRLKTSLWFNDDKMAAVVKALAAVVKSNCSIQKLEIHVRHWRYWEGVAENLGPAKFLDELFQALSTNVTLQSVKVTFQSDIWQTSFSLPSTYVHNDAIEANVNRNKTAWHMFRTLSQVSRLSKNGCFGSWADGSFRQLKASHVLISESLRPNLEASLATVACRKDARPKRGSPASLMTVRARAPSAAASSASDAPSLLSEQARAQAQAAREADSSSDSDDWE